MFGPHLSSEMDEASIAALEAEAKIGLDSLFAEAEVPQYLLHLSETDGQEVEGETGHEQTCAICLQKIDDPCILLRSLSQREIRSSSSGAKVASCEHLFCFLCIYTWSQLNSSCPLCKAPFSILVYEIRSPTDFKLVRLEEQKVKKKVNPATRAFTPVDYEGYVARQRQQNEGGQASGSTSISFRPASMSDDSSTSPWGRPLYSNRVALAHSSQQTERRRKSVYEDSLTPILPRNARSQTQRNLPGKRRRKGKAPLPFVSAARKRSATERMTFHKREPDRLPSSLTYVRCDVDTWNNRAAAWVTRELRILLQEEDVSLLCHFVRALILRRDQGFVFHRAAQEGEEVTSHLSQELAPFLYENVPRFIQELRCFLASGLTIGAYDTRVTYVDLKRLV